MHLYSEKFENSIVHGIPRIIHFFTLFKRKKYEDPKLTQAEIKFKNFQSNNLISIFLYSELSVQINGALRFIKISLETTKRIIKYSLIFSTIPNRINK